MQQASLRVTNLENKNTGSILAPIKEPYMF